MLGVLVINLTCKDKRIQATMILLFIRSEGSLNSLNVMFTHSFSEHSRLVNKNRTHSPTVHEVTAIHVIFGDLNYILYVAFNS